MTPIFKLVSVLFFGFLSLVFFKTNPMVTVLTIPATVIFVGLLVMDFINVMSENLNGDNE